MAYDYEADRARRETIARQRGEARLALCTALTEALTKASGDTWEPLPHPYGREDGSDAPEAFRGSRYRRKGDGFTLGVFGWQNDSERMQGSVAWPNRPDKPHERVLMRDAPGVPYNRAEPVTSFAVTRAATAVAKQLLRELVTAETVEAWHGLGEMFAKAMDSERQADHWLDTVATAGGLVVRVNATTGERHLPSRYTNWAGLEWSKQRPGGVLSFELPDNPHQAAEIVRALKALLGK